ncbi:MAG: mevalonate kinase [Thermaerobacter sp.]|nr:mevalonate kinase [Thermaerobacter sp.]
MIQGKTGRGTAHGKAILMGEHAVVYGFPAVAVPLPEIKVSVEAVSREGDDWLDCTYYRGSLQNAPGELGGLRLLIEDGLAQIKCRGPIGITIQSDIPSGYGLGSSAAVAAAVARALYHLAGAPLPQETLLDLVAVCETVCHGAPSGVDAQTATGLDPLWFVRGRSPEIVAIPNPMYLVVAASSQPGNTRDTVQQVRALKERWGSGTGPIDRIGALTAASRPAIEHGDYPYLGALMIEVHRELAALDVVTSEVEKLVTAALRHEALGAKLTGGGGGGSMVVLAKDRQQQRQLADVLRSAGATRVWAPIVRGTGLSAVN